MVCVFVVVHQQGRQTWPHHFWTLSPFRTDSRRLHDSNSGITLWQIRYSLGKENALVLFRLYPSHPMLFGHLLVPWICKWKRRRTSSKPKLLICLVFDFARAFQCWMGFGLDFAYVNCKLALQLKPKTRQTEQQQKRPDLLSKHHSSRVCSAYVCYSW